MTPPNRRSNGLPSEWFSDSPFFELSNERKIPSRHSMRPIRSRPVTAPAQDSTANGTGRPVTAPAQSYGPGVNVSDLVDVKVPQMEVPDVSLCLSTGDRPEVSMEYAYKMRDRALAEYREAKAEGAVWLWKRAIARAGGGRAITTFIFRLWANHCKAERSRSKKILRIVLKMQGCVRVQGAPTTVHRTTHTAQLTPPTNHP